MGSAQKERVRERRREGKEREGKGGRRSELTAVGDELGFMVESGREEPKRKQHQYAARTKKREAEMRTI